MASELQVQIDDVYACHGSCGGCVLSALERRATVPDMPPAVLDLAVARLAEYAASLGRLDRVNVTFAVADHLLMPNDYILRLHEMGASVIRAAAPADRSHSAVFFTTSLVGKPEDVAGRLRAIRSAAASDVPLLPIVVLAPALLHAAKFGPAYRDLILEAKALFGKVDLSINLSDEAVAEMSPGELMGFATGNGFDEVTVNWTPNLVNADKTCGDIAATAAWLLAFDDLLSGNPGVSTSFRPVLERTVAATMCRGDGAPPTLRSTVEDILPETIRRSVEVDHTGALLAKLEAVGDIFHADRFGMRPLGRLADAPIAELVARAIPDVQKRVLAAHAAFRACVECPVAGVCAGTGFHVVNRVMQLKGLRGAEDCPHVARALLERLVAEAGERDRAAAR
jgi:hypothetical protein